MKSPGRTKGCVLKDGFQNAVIRNDLGAEGILERIRTFSNVGGTMWLVMSQDRLQYTTRYKEEFLLEGQGSDGRIFEAGIGWVLSPKNEKYCRWGDFFFK